MFLLCPRLRLWFGVRMRGVGSLLWCVVKVEEHVVGDIFQRLIVLLKLENKRVYATETVEIVT